MKYNNCGSCYYHSEWLKMCVRTAVTPEYYGICKHYKMAYDE